MSAAAGVLDAEGAAGFRLSVKRVFDRYKRKDPWAPLLCLPVLDGEGRPAAFLRPVTADFRLTAPELPELLGRWREENPSLAPTYFKVTLERTLRWLDQAILGRDDRLLLVVHGLDGAPLGQVGYSNFDFDRRSGDVDGILRGAPGGAPGLMHHAMAALLRMGFLELGLREIGLSVLSDNERAIRFYERLGFVRAGLTPLVEIRRKDEVRWDPAPPGFAGKAEKHFLRMRLDPRLAPPPVREAAAGKDGGER